MLDVKEKVEEKKVQLIQLTANFCERYLDEEYKVVIDKLIHKMARKKDVPFVRGKIEVWAAAIIHAIGSVNFLYDKNTTPYVGVSFIYNHFNTKQSTTSQKSKRIRDMFDMPIFGGEFSTNSVNQRNPLNSLTEVNGLLVPKGMVNEQNPKKCILEDWELELANILGVSELTKEKKYSENELFKLLKVTDEKLMEFYDFLQHNLTFPFRASYEQEVGPIMMNDYEVNCLRLDQEMQYEEFYGVLMECRQGRKKVIVSLVEMEVDKQHPNYAIIDLYQVWFSNFR